MLTRSLALSALVGAGLMASAAFAQEMDSSVGPNTGCTAFTGSGTVNKVAKFRSRCAVEVSAISESGGNVGIATTSPHSALEIVGQTGSSNTNSVTITNSGIAGPSGVASVDFNTYEPFSGTYNPSSRFQANDDGQFGNSFQWSSNLPITQGGGNPNSGLYVLMTLNDQGTTAGGPSLVLTQGIGSALSDGWTTYSTRRLKTNIETIEGALDKVEQLRGVTYDRKDTGHHEMGVVAEEVAEVVPEVVARDPHTQEVQGVDYNRLTALLIEAVKQQQSSIRELESEVAQLKAEAQR